MSSLPNREVRQFERVLITGASGLTGRHLVEYIRSKATTKLFGFGLGNSIAPSGCEMLQGDITLKNDIDTAVKYSQPDCIIHLAGVLGFASYQKIFDVNVLGTLHLLEAVRLNQLSATPIVLIVGSSAIYGAVSPDQLPIIEETPLKPLSHYGVSKVAQHSIGLQYYLNWQIPIIRVHPFNLVGPGQSSDLLCGSLVEQFIAIERGQRPPVLSLGNLSPQRDFLDVRDAVRAYWSLVSEGVAGQVYNAGSGVAYSVQDIVNLLQELSGIKVKIQQKASRKRGIDVPIQIGDSTKLREATGWRPNITLRDSLNDMLQWQRAAS